MENENKIRLMGIRPHKALQCFIEKQIDKWVARERTLMFLPKESDYNVLFRKDGERFYLCQVQLRIGTKYWEGVASDKSLHKAFMQAIKHMKYVVVPTKSPSAPAHQALGSVA
jgi:hypothetical protein